MANKEISSRNVYMIQNWFTLFDRNSCFTFKLSNFCLWNPESLASESGIPLEEYRIPLTIGIRNPRATEKYLESSTWNPESTGWNPESKTVLVGDTF